MSHSLSSSSSPSPAPPSPNHDFTALASALQDIAQVLLEYGKTLEPETPEPETSSQSKQEEPSEQATSSEQCIQFSYNPNGDRTPAFDKLYGSILDGYERDKFHDEIRCYTLPASAVRNERKLFDTHEGCNLHEFLDATCNELAIHIKLLSALDENEYLSATELYLISNNLCNPLEKFRKLHNQLEAFDLVYTTIVSEQ